MDIVPERNVDRIISVSLLHLFLPGENTDERTVTSGCLLY